MIPVSLDCPFLIPLRYSLTFIESISKEIIRFNFLSTRLVIDCVAFVSTS